MIRKLFDARAALFYLFAFAFAIGAATFIENDFGTDTAQKVVYQAWWFELLLLLFSGSLVYNIIRFQMIRRKRWGQLIFHAAMLLILVGAGVTRYFGFEGMMHIREGSTQNQFLSRETYLTMEFQVAGNIYRIEEPVLFGSLGSNRRGFYYDLQGHAVSVFVDDAVPNPQMNLVEDPNGVPSLNVVVGSAQGRNTYAISQGEAKSIAGQFFEFRSGEARNAESSALTGAGDNLQANPATFRIIQRAGQLYFTTDEPVIQRVMATQEIDTLAANAEWPLKLRSLYTTRRGNYVFSQYLPAARQELQSTDVKIKSGSPVAVQMRIETEAGTEPLTVYGTKGLMGDPTPANLGPIQARISYGSRPVTLPFALHLHDFIMTRYPGTNSPESFASEVQLLDPEQGVDRPYRIYMNHILNYRGYRFFQSSYDRDEAGTYLSVNNDFWGTWLSYAGYFLLTLGMIWTLLSKATRFHELSHRIRELRKRPGHQLGLWVVGIALLGSVSAGATDVQVPQIQRSHADAFSQVIVQDVRGRMKPVHTLNREVMRKVHGSEEFQGMSADQVMLSLFASPPDWYAVPFIKLGKSPKLRQQLGVTAKYAAYRDFFAPDGSYKLSEDVQQANRMDPTEKGVYEKELIQVDERVNILNMVFSGHLFRLVPIPDDPAQTWVAASHRSSAASSEVADKFFPAYRDALLHGLQENHYEEAQELVAGLDLYQREFGAAVLPSETQRSEEIFLNNIKVFNRLAPFYSLLGLIFLSLLLIQVFKPEMSGLQAVFKLLFGLLALGFAAHTLGLALRWYVSERAPWSNGYESMIYIAWTTTLAGLIFTRKSTGGLAATNVLSGIILLIAMLSYLNPEITPLVPVLKSYWLTIHVSLEAGSYGFLMLGAVIGMINLILMALTTSASERRVKALIRELSYISEMTLIGGLFMLSVGTYLGGVWANESWGRYWGWDAKETWALVSILVYAVILHLRFVPKVNGLFAYNFASLFGLASIIMTYFGVNYYLSGLHSYAAGDPVPIPSWVYYAVFALSVLSLLAGLKARKYKF